MSFGSSNSLSGKVAVVTGGASGIGLAIVKLLLKSGAKIGIFDIQINDEFSTLENVHFVKANIMSEESVKSAVSEILAKWGHLDVLVNNAGIMDEKSRTGDTTNEIWDRVFAINVTGSFYLTRLAIKTFMKQETRGNVINVCSIAAIRGSAACAAYTASKHALLGLSRSTAWGYARDGIRCNAVLPGGVVTPIMRDVTVDVDGDKILEPFMGTMPGLCQPSDMAEAVLFLATANAVNGAELAVDKGWSTS